MIGCTTCWPSAWCWRVTRYGGLGDAEPEHEKFTMYPWRAPEKVLMGYPCNQMADLSADPRTPTSPGDHVIDISTSLTSRYDAIARRFPAERSPGFGAIAATSTTARFKAADQYDGSRGDEFGCAPVRQFDGAARSIPTAAWCGFGARFGRPELLRLSASS
jgi:hypothetical protein